MAEEHVGEMTVMSPPSVPAGTASDFRSQLVRGFLGNCPSCGKGHMFRAFLKVADRCDACGEELFHHQADDFPAYLVIVFVGHLIVGLVMWAEASGAFSALAEIAIFLPLTIALSLALLQPTKGAVVALQWAMGMHGFANARRIAADRPAVQRVVRCEA